MLALQYRKSALRYVWMRLLGRRSSKTVTRPGAFLRLAQVPEPDLPGPSWVRVRPILSGICGSDVAAATGSSSIYLSAFLSSPFVPGHEVAGRVTEVGPEVSSVQVDERVVLEPALGCVVRGFQEMCRPCTEGYYGNCERVTAGDIAPGIQTGYCRDTGGGWSTQLVAHESQLHHVPDEVPDEAAVLAEPLSCAVHGVLKAQIAEGSRVLVIGCGAIGLLTIAALRSFAPSCTIVAMARYTHQQALAIALGADHVVQAGRNGYEQLAGLSDAALYPLPIGKPAILGGFDATFECSGSHSGVEDALRWTRSHGQVVMLGMPHVSKIDLVPLWSKELSVQGSYTYSMEMYGEDRLKTFDLALSLLARDGWAERLGRLVSHRFPLRRHRAALTTAMSPGNSGAVKVAFDFTEEKP